MTMNNIRINRAVSNLVVIPAEIGRHSSGLSDIKLINSTIIRTNGIMTNCKFLHMKCELRSTNHVSAF